MKTPPPFVPNSDDDVHCVNAVFRMVHQYYFGEDLTWDEIDRITKAEPGKGTWTFIMEAKLAKKGLAVKNIEPIDYEKLHAEGIEYLRTVFNERLLDFTLNETNIRSVLADIPDFLKYVEHETRRASIEEIAGYLKEGKLVGAEINSGLFNKTGNFSLHFVLLYDTDGDDVILHDPGLPPMPGRRVSAREFEEAFNYEGANGEVVVFSK